MRNLAPLHLLAALLLAVAGPAHANLIVNGSFEADDIPAGAFTITPNITGWQGTFGSGIEIQDHIVQLNGQAALPFDGDQHVELDSFSNSGMQQSVSTTPGQSYLLEFYYSPRTFVAANSNGIEVLWGGVLIDTIAEDGVANTNTVWGLHSYLVQATGATTVLGFAAVGLSDALGGYLDAVSLVARDNGVPEPLPAGLLALGLLLAAASGRRRPAGA